MLPPFVEPLAFVVTLAFWVACAVSPPVRMRSGPLPTVALVVMFEIEIATCAEMATLPLPADAPPSAVVVIASVPVDVSVRFLAPFRTASLGRPAVVVSLTTLTATEAPTPDALPSVACFAVAIAWLSKFEVAPNERSAPFSATGSVPSTSEVVFATTTLTASEPATPTLLPPAPEVDWALKVEAAGAVVSSVTPPDLRLALWASQVPVLTTATLMATAMAMPEVAVVGSAPDGTVAVLSR